MFLNKLLGGRGTLVAVGLPVLIILFPFGYSLASFVAARGVSTPQPFLERPDAQYDKCVAETDFMRLHHWEMLRGIREEIVRYGMRGEVGLKNCADCHTSRERFCDRCHNAVSMTPDCFGCHYYP